MPIDIVPLKLKGRKSPPGRFKYVIIQKDLAPVHERFPKHLLADTAEEAEAVFKMFSKVVNDLARSYAAGSGLNRADLFGEAVIGLARAKRDFDPRRSKNFKTFAIYKMKDTLNDYVRSFSSPVPVPAYLKRVSRWVGILEEVLRSAMLPEVDVEAILNGRRQAFLPGELHDHYLELSEYLAKEAKRLNVTQEELVKRARAIPKEFVSEPDGLAASDDELYTRIMVEELKRHMTETELRISEMIMAGKTYKEIADVFGRTAPWVRQQLDKIKDRLKDKFEI
jgi:RNA polymerase sigma factor (sigma-70 family)